MAGAGGFEPPNTGSKDPRLTAWRRPNVSAFAQGYGGQARPIDTCACRRGQLWAVQTHSVAEGCEDRQASGGLAGRC